jgi:hypothetical protein
MLSLVVEGASAKAFFVSFFFFLTEVQLPHKPAGLSGADGRICVIDFHNLGVQSPTDGHGDGRQHLPLRVQHPKNCECLLDFGCEFGQA